MLLKSFTLYWPHRAKIACDWWPVALKLYPSGCHLHANCTHVVASHMQLE